MIRLSLQLIEHLGQGVLDSQGFFDFVRGDIRILTVFYKARALVVPDKADERFRPTVYEAHSATTMFRSLYR